MDVAGLRRATPSFYERERGVAGEREVPETWGAAALPPPHIYRGKGEGARPPQIQSEEGAAAKGGRSATQVKWSPPP